MGHTGRLCSRCKPGYYSSSRACTECNGHSAEVVIFIVAAASVGFYIYLIKTAGDIHHSELASVLKSFFFYLQTASILFSKCAFTWPQLLKQFQNGFLWSNFTLSILQCLSSSFDFEGNYILVFVAPFLFTLFALVFFLAGDLYYRQFGAMKDRVEWRLGCIRAALTSINLVYLPLIVYILQSFNCSKDSSTDSKYLVYYPWIQCSFDTAWKSYFVMAIFGLFLNVLGIPLLLGGILYWKRQFRKEPTVKRWLGFFYIIYKEKYYWFEMVIVLRRLALGLGN